MGMSADAGHGEQKKSAAVPFINVTPLIDVLLVLLIIFMVITPLKPTRFKALVPTEPPPTNEPVKPNPLTLVVSIESDFKLKLNTDDAGSVNDTGPLSQRLSQTFQERRAQRLLHVADAGAGRRQRQIGAFRAVRNRARLDDMPKQAEVGEIEAHGASL